MLGKYIKHEIKDTSKIMLMMYSVIIVLTLLGKIYISQIVEKSGGNGIVSGILMMVYVLGIFAATIVSSIYLIVNFYNTMFGDTAYLTHTLPIKRSTIINVKVLVMFVWTVILSILAVESVLIISSGSTGVIDIHNQLFETFNQFSEKSIFLHVFIIMLLSILSTFLEIAFCFSIGQMSNKHKIGFAILAYVALYFIKQILGVILMLNSGYMFESGAYYSPNEVMNIFKTSTYAIILVSSAIYYFGTLYLCKNKLNLK